MSKLLSKITVTSIAIATVLGGAYYFTSTQEANQTVSVNNSVMAEDTAQATMVSV